MVLSAVLRVAVLPQNIALSTDSEISSFVGALLLVCVGQDRARSFRSHRGEVRDAERSVARGV